MTEWNLGQPTRVAPSFVLSCPLPIVAVELKTKTKNIKFSPKSFPFFPCWNIIIVICAMEKSSIPLVYIFLLPLLFSQSVASESGSISILITEKGLDFVRELAVEQAVGSLVPLHLRDLEKTLSVPFIGKVYAKLSNITLHQINVSSSLINPGSSGITIVASDAKAKASMDWFYSYSSWLLPFDFSDRGTASIQVTFSR